MPLFLGFAGVALTSGSTRSAPDFAAPLLSSFPPLHLSATALLICRKKWNSVFYTSESLPFDFFLTLPQGSMSILRSGIQCSTKHLNDGFRWTLTWALYAQTNLNEHHFVRFRFFPGPKIRPNPVGESLKSKALLKDQFWQSSRTTGELSSSLPGRTQSSSTGVRSCAFSNLNLYLFI